VLESVARAMRHKTDPVRTHRSANPAALLRRELLLTMTWDYAGPRLSAPVGPFRTDGLRDDGPCGSAHA
jgi:hypothetical protein